MNRTHAQKNPLKSHGASMRRRGFTIIEMLVAIVAVALLTAGIAQVFRVTSQTVSLGRKLSNLNNHASLVERRLREDFSRISRQGFVVIRNEQLTGTLRSNDDRTPRARRADILQFFTEGAFETSRDPMNPGLIVQGAAQRVYYGHGMRWDQNAANYGNAVNIDDPNDVPYLGQPGPNQYAKDWLLARHVTLLVPPKTAQKYVPDPANPTGPYILENSVPEESDSRVQIGRHPAAPSIFRNAVNVGAVSGIATIRGGGVLPSFACGVVDIASMDLGTIRNQIMSGQPYATFDGVGSPQVAISDSGVRNAPGTPPADKRNNIHEAMKNSLPTDADGAFGPPTRIRVEPAPPNPMGIAWPAAPTEAQRIDQMMLSNHLLAPGCTEFIVEWTYGEIGFGNGSDGTPDGARVKWFGLPRVVNSDADPASTFAYAVQPYAYPNYVVTSHSFKPRIPILNAANNPPTPMTIQYVPPQDLVSGQNPVIVAGARTVGYSYFGYLDPFWPPERALGKPWDAAPVTPRTTRLTVYDETDPVLELYGVDGMDLSTNFDTIRQMNVPVMSHDTNRDGMYNPLDGDQLNFPETLPWKWPKMIRITLTLCDPIDPAVEKSYQYVFTLPDGPSRQ